MYGVSLFIVQVYTNCLLNWHLIYMPPEYWGSVLIAGYSSPLPLTSQLSRLNTDTPAGKLPVLEIEGKMLNQSLAIGRFLASKAGLLAEDPLDAAFCDAIAESMKELAVVIYDVK